MNFFCRIYGHTWVHEAQDPKISWNNDKGQVQLHPIAHGEPEFLKRCQRCGDHEPWKKEVPAAEAPKPAPPAAAAES